MNRVMKEAAGYVYNGERWIKPTEPTEPKKPTEPTTKPTGG